MTDQQIYDLAHRQLADQLGGGFGGDLLARFIAPGIANQTVSERNKLAVEQLQNMVTSGQFANFVNIPSKDTGGIGLADMPYLIGKPQENNEIFVPRATGDFIPNFMEKMDALFERENTPSIGTVIVNANTEEGGRAAARGFVDEFERTLRSKG